jgi:hypothetical protein
LSRGWLLESDEFFARALAATAASPSALVRDAHRLFTELRDGRRTVGTADLQEARERYRVWINDEQAYQRHKRTTRRAELEGKLAPSEHGIELVRADWPLAVPAVTAPMPAPARTVTWDGTTLELVVDGVARTLPKPADTSLYIATYQPKAALSPSGRRLVVDATRNQPTADGKSRENAQVLVEHDLDAGTWRVLSNAAGGQWLVAIDEDRWVYGDGRTAYLLRDTGETLADATYTATLEQPKAFCLPDLGVVIAYGSPDLANGRPIDDRGAPRVRLIGFWRDRLAEVAAFPIDGVELAAEHVDGAWRVGLISADRTVAWELRGLAAGVAAWRAASQAAEAAERAKREAFGEVTIHNAIAALDTFVGTSYGAEIQDGVSKVFERMLETLRGDDKVVAAAKATEKGLDFVTHVKGPFATGLMQSGLGPQFMNFAVMATMMNPKIADVVVRAATMSAWKALRGD